MLSTEDKHKLEKIASKYKVAKIYLFGSGLNTNKEPNDIDLAVEGLSDSLFFNFYSDLIFALSKPVDLIDLKKDSLLTNMVRAEGILIYG